MRPESLVRSGWVTLIGVKEMVAVGFATCVARGGNQPVRLSRHLARVPLIKAPQRGPDGLLRRVPYPDTP
jgi:hypothetical protein